MPVQPAYLFLFLPVCCFQRGATFVLVVAWCFTPDGVVDNRQSSRRCAFLLPPLFLSRYYVLLVSLLLFTYSFVSLWWLYGGRQQRVWQPSHPLFGGRRTRC